MPKAQVLVTVTAEAFVEIPDGVEDVDAFVRRHVSLVWGEANATVTQMPAVNVEHYLVPEPEPEPEPVAEIPAAVVAGEGEEEPSSDTLPLPAAVAAVIAPADEPVASEAVAAAEPAAVAGPIDVDSLLDDPAYRSILRAAIRDRAAGLLEAVVDQVVAELEPLLRRHHDKHATGA